MWPVRALCCLQAADPNDALPPPPTVVRRWPLCVVVVDARAEEKGEEPRKTLHLAESRPSVIMDVPTVVYVVMFTTVVRSEELGGMESCSRILLAGEEAEGVGLLARLWRVLIGCR